MTLILARTLRLGAGVNGRLIHESGSRPFKGNGMRRRELDIATTMRRRQVPRQYNFRRTVALSTTREQFQSLRPIVPCLVRPDRFPLKGSRLVSQFVIVFT